MREMAKVDVALEWWLEGDLPIYNPDAKDETDENYFTPSKVSRDPISTFGISDASMSQRPRVSPPWGYIELDAPKSVPRSIFVDVDVDEMIDNLVLSVNVSEPAASEAEFSEPLTPD